MTLTFEEQFDRFRKEFNQLWIKDFRLFDEMSDRWQVIKTGLIKEKSSGKIQ